MYGPTEFQCGFAPGPVKVSSGFAPSGTSADTRPPRAQLASATPPEAAPRNFSAFRLDILRVIRSMAIFSRVGTFVRRTSRVTYSCAVLFRRYLPASLLVAFSLLRLNLHVFFSAFSLRPLCLRVILLCLFVQLLLFLFSSSLLAARNARHPAPPTMHRAPHSSSSESLPRLPWRVLPATRATPRDAPCPLPRAPRNTPAPPAASRRKTSSIHRSSSWRSPALAIRKRRVPLPPPPLAGPRKSRGISAPPPASRAGQGST